MLLEEIARIALMLGRTLPDAPLPVSPVERSLEDPASPLERIRLLDALWPRILAALEAIERCPETRLAAEKRSVLPRQSHGGPDVAHSLASTPQGLTVWTEIQQSRSGAGPPRRIQEMRPQSALDTVANRLALAVVKEVEGEARALASLAAFCEEDAEAERMLRILDAVGKRRHSSLLSGLLSPPAHWKQTLPESAVSARFSPPYRALFNTWKQWEQSLHFDWSHLPLLSLPTLEEWHLYEIWCYLQVAAALHAADWRLLEGNALRWTADGLRLTLSTGRMSRLRFRAPRSRTGERRKGYPSSKAAFLELFYQPYYPSANQSRSTSGIVSEQPGYVSLTHVMQPDIALQWRGRLYLLDPKLRPYAEPGAEQEDVDKMHTYRDAIVAQSAARNTRRAVAAAWCLFPGLAENGISPPVRAYPTASAVHPFGTAGIGALRLRPGDPTSLSLLSQLFKFWLHDR